MKAKLVFLSFLFAVSVKGASLLTLSNPIADNAINTTAGNNDRSDWNGLTAYPADPDESAAVDYNMITVAHDSLKFYIREEMFRNNNSGFLSGDQVIAIDTDQNRATGYRGASDTYAVGGEYMLQGASLFEYTGSGTDWGWNFIATASFDDFPINDHELSFNRSSLGGTNGPDAFDFIAITDFFGSGDTYPDGGHSGSSGSFYTYTAIPEPSSVLLLVSGLASLMLFGRIRRK